jgi:hypothetical protein
MFMKSTWLWVLSSEAPSFLFLVENEETKEALRILLG